MEQSQNQSQETPESTAQHPNTERDSLPESLMGDRFLSGDPTEYPKDSQGLSHNVKKKKEKKKTKSKTASSPSVVVDSPQDDSVSKSAHLQTETESAALAKLDYGTGGCQQMEVPISTKDETREESKHKPHKSATKLSNVNDHCPDARNAGRSSNIDCDVNSTENCEDNRGNEMEGSHERIKATHEGSALRNDPISQMAPISTKDDASKQPKHKPEKSLTKPSNNQNHCQDARNAGPSSHIINDVNLTDNGEDNEGSKSTRHPTRSAIVNLSTTEIDHDIVGCQLQAKKNRNKKKKRKQGGGTQGGHPERNSGDQVKGAYETTNATLKGSASRNDPISKGAAMSTKDETSKEPKHKPERSITKPLDDHGHCQEVRNAGPSLYISSDVNFTENREDNEGSKSVHLPSRSAALGKLEHDAEGCQPKANEKRVRVRNKNMQPETTTPSGDPKRNSGDEVKGAHETIKVTFKGSASRIDPTYQGARISTKDETSKEPKHKPEKSVTKPLNDHGHCQEVGIAGPSSRLKNDVNITEKREDNGGWLNMLCILQLFYGVGLGTLRKLFMKINPTWSNTSRDAAAFDKGIIELGKTEEAVFRRGDINKWDFSLLTTVLLLSPTCQLKIGKRTDYICALRELKEKRNKLLGHPSTDKMTDVEFNLFWPGLSKNFITLGADKDDIERIKLQSEKDVVAADYYKELFEEERRKQALNEEWQASMERKMDTILAICSNSKIEAVPCPDEVSRPKWDEWLRFLNAVGNFDTQKNQYILVTDGMPDIELELCSILKGIAWKTVLDFDAKSEENGFYREFKTGEPSMSNLVSLFTPEELNKTGMKTLSRQVDSKRIQWLFVNGRADDRSGDGKDFPDWATSSVKGVNRLFTCISDAEVFDTLKPVICLILPIKHQTKPFLKVTLSRLIENFLEHSTTLVSVGLDNFSDNSHNLSVQSFDLSTRVLNLGLKAIFGTPNDHVIRIPTSHAGVYAQLNARQYVYIKEFLEVLYLGCEKLPEDSCRPREFQVQGEEFLEEQRKSFLSGNEISFVSLYHNHDARREIENEIKIHLQRLLDQELTRPIIVEIRHSPGTGGTTIARRVLWDLHKEFPCALTTISSHHYSDEDNIFANGLADRIISLEETCNTTPLILFDGKQSGTVEGLSNKLTRILQSRGKRALILRCLRGKALSSLQEAARVHKVFRVNFALEDSHTDLTEFKSKYKEYLESIEGLSVKQQVVPDPCRVFHFPLLSMMNEFRPKLEKIIEDTIKELGGIEQEIAVLVAFLQNYANFPTPGVLLLDAFRESLCSQKKRTATYEDVKQLFSEHLMNLMIPAKQTTGGWVKAPESYTFQHPVVANLILERVCRVQKRDLFGVVDQFLQFPIYGNETLLPLLLELFIYNKKVKGHIGKLKFSLLFEDLNKKDSNRAAEIFIKAAQKVNHPVLYGNAARFCAKKDPPLFTKAKELIDLALKVHKSTSKGKYKNLWHAKGLVLYFELQFLIKNGEINELKRLEEKASEVLQAYREARDYPLTYPHPLIGAVEVWIQCITWIMNNICKQDTEETFDYLTNLSPAFFRNCVSESFGLLDRVDAIVESVAHLSDPEETMRLSRNLRLSLMQTFPKRFASHGRRKGGDDIVQVCRAICSSKNFCKSSQLEIKILQAQYMLNSSESVESMKRESLLFLLKLLEDLVINEGQCSLAHHLLKVCTLVSGKQGFNLEKGLEVCEKWSAFSSRDCLPHFYKMAIYFLKILDGNPLEFLPKYREALTKCKEESDNHLRRPYAALFVGKEGEGMSRLITFKSLLDGETDYSTDNFDRVSKFWRYKSRKKLLECRGRIKMRSSTHGKSLPYIELLQGNIELYVSKHADIGKEERDFTPGELVYFVISFNLQGPVANGITFLSHDLHVEGLKQAEDQKPTDF